MPRYKLTVEYLGTNFSGWQKQKNNHTIQKAIEESAKNFTTRYKVGCCR